MHVYPRTSISGYVNVGPEDPPQYGGGAYDWLGHSLATFQHLGETYVVAGAPAAHDCTSGSCLRYPKEKMSISCAFL